MVNTEAVAYVGDTCVLCRSGMCFLSGSGEVKGMASMYSMNEILEFYGSHDHSYYKSDNW